MKERLSENGKIAFSDYQIFIITALTILQFIVILGFAIISPIGDIVMKSLNINTSRYGLLVSSYAFGAGISGVFVASVADKFDRKKILMFFFTGFLTGIFLCGFSSNYSILLVARIISGVFGGVINSISLAIVSDLFLLKQRGRVMGYLQMAFSVSQILGIPLGIILANKWGWNSAFIAIAVVGTIVGIVVAIKMRPVNEHLKLQSDKNLLQHFKNIIVTPKYLPGYLLILMVTMGGAMLMPFSAPFLINNIDITQQELPVIYVLTGIASVFIMIIVGKFSDIYPLKSVFLVGTLITIIMTLIYTNLVPVPIWIIVLINIVLFTGTNGRLIPAMTLNTAIPEQKDRGAYLSLCSAFQQIANGSGALVAGFIIVQQTKTSPLLHYDIVGYVVIIFSIICVFLVYKISRRLNLIET